VVDRPPLRSVPDADTTKHRLDDIERRVRRLESDESTSHKQRLAEIRHEVERAAEGGFKQVEAAVQSRLADLGVIKKELELAKEERIRRSERESTVSDLLQQQREKAMKEAKDAKDTAEAAQKAAEVRFDRRLKLFGAVTALLVAFGTVIGVVIGSHH